MIDIDPPCLGGSNLFHDVIGNLKEIRKKKYALLSDFSYDLFMMKTSKSISKICKSNQIMNSCNYVKIATKVFIYMKLRKDHLLDFYATLENLNSTDLSATITCNYVKAKFIKLVPRGLVKKFFTSFVDKQESSLINLAYFAYFMITESSNSTIFCINEYVDLISKIIFSCDQEVRLYAFDSLNILLNTFRNASSTNLEPIILSLFHKAKEKLTGSLFHEQHGSFLIMNSILPNIPQQIINQSLDLLDFFISSINVTELHEYSLYNIIILARYNKETFLKDHYDMIYDIITEDNCSDQTSSLSSHCLLLFYMTFSEQMISNESKMTEILNNLINYRKSIKNAYQIITHISINYSFFIEKNTQFFSSLFLRSIQFINEVSHEFVKLITAFPSLFDSSAFARAILDEFQKNRTRDFLEFLSLCPPLNNDQIQHNLISILSSPEGEMRGQASSSILRQISYDDRDFVCDVFHHLFTLALSDPDPSVRSKIVAAFNHHCYKYLTLPVFLGSLNKLCHDESVEVRNSTIDLLGKISQYDPMNVYVVLRKILLEHMYTIDVKEMKSVKFKVSQSLLHIFMACREILPLYTPTFCDVALRELSNTPTGKLTYFEQKFFNDISKNIMKIIRFIAETDISLMKSHLKQFINFFIWQLQQDLSKEVKLSVIKTLYVILTRDGSIDDIDKNQLSLDLMGFAAKWNSTKINLAILKLAGFIGVSIQNSDLDAEKRTGINDEIKCSDDVSLNDPSYFLSCACTTLLSILNNDKYISYHISCLKALTSIFSNDPKMYGLKYFSEFIKIVINQIHSNIANSDDYIDVLNQICHTSPYQWVLKYRSEIINLTQEMLEKKDFSEKVLDLIPTLSLVFKTEAGIIYQNGIAFLYDILEKNMKKEDGIDISIKSINAIISMRHVSESFSLFVITKLLYILSKESVMQSVKKKIIDSFSFLFQQPDIDMSSFSPNILRSLLRVLYNADISNDLSLIERAMQAIYSLIVKSGSEFAFLKMSASSAIEQLKNITEAQKNNYNEMLNRAPPYSFTDFSFIQIQDPLDFQNSTSIHRKNPHEKEENINNMINKDSKSNEQEKNNKNSSKNDHEKDINNSNNCFEEDNNNNKSKVDSEERVNNNNDCFEEENSNNKSKVDSEERVNNNNNCFEEENNNNKSKVCSEERNNGDVNTYRIDEEAIKKAISMQEEETPWNWKDWYNHLVLTAITMSPSPYISSCSFLCEELLASAESIFQPAFLTVWFFMTDAARQFVSETFTRAFNSDSLPKYVCSTIISLLEYLERSECHVIVSKRVICEACLKCSQYRSAFYFAWKWLLEDPASIEANETMIKISTYFGQIKMTKGLAKRAQKIIDTSSSPAWFELLGQWTVARQIYERQGFVGNFSKIMKCLAKEQLWDEVVEKFDSIMSSEIKQTSSKYILMALYHCHKMERIDEILPFCPKNSVTVLSILALFLNSKGRKKEALESIEKAFNILASNSRGLIKQDQALLDKLIIKSQQLHEVLEIILNEDFKMSKKIREKRIEKCPKTYNFYHQILSISLNMMPIESNIKYVLRMLKYALKEQQFHQFYSSLNYLFPDKSKWPASVAFIHCKSIWETGKRKEAIEKIDSILKDPLFMPQIEADPKLKCKMYYMYAEWIFNNSLLTSVFHVLKTVVDLLEVSMRTKVRFYKSFHRWAWGCSLMFSRAPNVKQHAVSAIHGFLECIKLKKETPFDDLVQMISLFFKVNLDEKSFEEISQRIGMLNDSNFLLIIPQLFAQITSNEKAPQSLFIAKILTRLLPNHYHVLLMNLLFDREPNQIINNLYNWFFKNNSTAVSEGLTIKKGLVLCSSSTMEYWLIDITKTIAAVQKKNLKLAVETLSDAISRQLQPGESEKEEEFRNKIQQVLISILSNFKRSPHTSTNDVPVSVPSHAAILEAMKKSRSDPNIKNINVFGVSVSKTSSSTSPKEKSSIIIEVVQQLKKIYSLIKEHLSNIQYLSMFNVAPDLFLLRNTSIAVPGTYEPSKPKTLIKQFDPTLEIYNSKQRPRFLVIYGSDGSRHKSLLKGREDLRLDNRLMQFFLLINQHIRQSCGSGAEKNQQQAMISRYCITPITKKCGLIQYVDGVDTIFSLITEYRSNHSMNIFAEQTIETSFASPNVDSLRPIQRMEALREAASKTKDDDLRKIMWLKSPSSKDLMLRTSMFAQSNAVMSIVCYILGIGDRHPSNLLIHKRTGKVIHIDFGDCFEASRRRKFFPELIPFRLTRMMIKAFGPTEIEGDFRITCEQTLKLVQGHVSSIISILDIFMQEPLEDSFNTDPKKSVYISKRKNKNNDNQNLRSGLNEFDQSLQQKQKEFFNDFYEEEDNGEIEEENISPDIKECIKRVAEKIIGKDSDLINNNDDLLSIEDQVSFLIRNATDEYNFSYLYHGWTPLW